VLRAILSTGAAPAARGCSAPPSTPDATALAFGQVKCEDDAYWIKYCTKIEAHDVR